MSTNDYRASLKTLIDSTEGETLLRQWKDQLEWDIEHAGEAELSPAVRSVLQTKIHIRFNQH